MSNRNTETKEGAMSNANATTEGTAPAPERLLPTRPGWWWVKLARNLAPELVRVSLLGADLYVSGWANSRVDERSDIEWLAEVPPPDVCAAWAANGRPSAAVLEALGEYMRAVVPFGYTWTIATRDVLEDARIALHAAIRAERAAQGSAPVGGDA